MIVGVYRGVDDDEWDDEDLEYCSGNVLRLQFCSQEHGAAHLARAPLPPGREEVDDDESGLVACLLLVIIALMVFGMAVFGLVQLSLKL